MATHSSVLAWRIPGMGELGGLLSMGSHRVGHNWSDLAVAAALYKNWCFQTLVLEKTLETPLGRKEIQPVHPKGNQSWILIGRTDAEAPVLWPPDTESQLIGPDAGKDWRWEKKGMTEGELVGWHHWLNGHEFEQTLGVGDGQGSLACYSPWDHKESDVTEQLNNKDSKTDLSLVITLFPKKIK